MVEKEINGKKKLLQLLSSAFDVALKGVALEAEALEMAKSVGEDDFSVKLKRIEVQEQFIYAQMLVKDKAEVEFGDLLSEFGDFDLLRNQVNNLCVDIFSAPEADRQAVIDSKECAKKKGAELIEKLQKSL